MKKMILFLLMIFATVSFAARLEITNDTGSYSFYYVNISSSSSDSWGDDKLGSSETISAGDTRSFRLNSGTYDVKIEDEDGDEYIFWDVEVSGTVGLNVDLGNIGEQYWGGGSSLPSNPSSGGSAPITIENDLGSWTIWYIHGSPVDASWGEDRLGSELLDPGESFTFYVNAGENYDLKCEDEDGDTYTLWDVYVGSDGFYWSVELSDMDN